MSSAESNPEPDRTIILPDSRIHGRHIEGLRIGLSDVIVELWSSTHQIVGIQEMVRLEFDTVIDFALAELSRILGRDLTGNETVPTFVYRPRPEPEPQPRLYICPAGSEHNFPDCDGSCVDDDSPVVKS